MHHFNKPQHLFDYYYFHKNLDDSMISNIFETVSQLNYITAKVKSNDINEIRKSQIKWISFSKETLNLFLSLENLINYANINYFNFDIINSYDDIQYTEYNESNKGEYDWHVDASYPSSHPYRKLSLTIQLSDPTEYEGGDLEISIPAPEKNDIFKIPKEKGKIIVFPSYLWHRVTPVTKGTRKSLVWWVGGSPFRQYINVGYV